MWRYGILCEHGGLNPTSETASELAIEIASDFPASATSKPACGSFRALIDCPAWNDKTLGALLSVVIQAVGTACSFKLPCMASIPVK
jgi:hypothetical protein